PVAPMNPSVTLPAPISMDVTPTIAPGQARTHTYLHASKGGNCGWAASAAARIMPMRQRSAGSPYANYIDPWWQTDHGAAVRDGTCPVWTESGASRGSFNILRRATLQALLRQLSWQERNGRRSRSAILQTAAAGSDADRTA